MSALVLPCSPFLGELPDAMKHVRWCERGRLQSLPLLDSSEATENVEFEVRNPPRTLSFCALCGSISDSGATLVPTLGLDLRWKEEATLLVSPASKRYATTSPIG